jgi:hypothetical protein
MNPKMAEKGNGDHLIKQKKTISSKKLLIRTSDNIRRIPNETAKQIFQYFGMITVFW